jgi:hypothetical protein
MTVRLGRAVLVIALALVAACSSSGGEVTPTSAVVPTTGPTSSLAPPSSSVAPSTSVAASPATTSTTTPPTTPAPATTTTTLPATEDALAPLLEWTDASSYTGVAALLLARYCTATLVDTGVDTGPAYLVTAGHCTEAALQEQNSVIVGRPTEGAARFLKFDNGPPAYIVFDAVNVAYATMKHNDIAVVELGESLGALRSAGLRPLRINGSVPASGTAVTNPGIPAVDPNPEARFVRMGQCTVAAGVLVVEYIWGFDAIPNDCPGLRPGSSGSPLVAADGTIVGIINTTAPATPDGHACERDHPCEARDDGVEMVLGRGYATSASAVAACFGPDGRFGLDVPGCTLEPGTNVQVSTFPRSAVAGQGTYTVEVRGPADSTVQLKQGPVGSTHCTQPDGYGPPAVIGARLEVEQPVPSTTGVEVACVLPAGTPVEQALAAYLAVQP